MPEGNIGVIGASGTGDSGALFTDCAGGEGLPMPSEAADAI